MKFYYKSAKALVIAVLVPLVVVQYSYVQAGPSGQKGQRKSHTILPFEGFGPSVKSHGLLGQAWNLWKSEGHELPDDVPVKVVVYRGMKLSTVKNMYPVVRGKNDYRYVEYKQAVRYLKDAVKDVEEAKSETDEATQVQMWSELLKTLKQTETAIMQDLGSD